MSVRRYTACNPGTEMLRFVRIHKVSGTRKALMKNIVCIALLMVYAGIAPAHAAAPTLSTDGRTLSLLAENQTFGQVMGLFQRQMGLELDIPGDLNGLRLPLVEI